MISIEEYRKIISELIDELPEVFFRKLSGGVIVSEATAVPDYARGDDLYTMGQYQVTYGMRQIVMYKGSFDRGYPWANAAEARSLIRSTLRHEFRHHLESIGGIHNSSSLEAPDERNKQTYLDRHET